MSAKIANKAYLQEASLQSVGRHAHILECTSSRNSAAMSRIGRKRTSIDEMCQRF